MQNNKGFTQTKVNLTNSLKKLMVQKSVNKITIREITDDCGVNRQTFYHHFTDIYDQLKWMYEQEALSLLNEHEGVNLWQEGLLQLLEYIQQNRQICLCTFHSMGHEHLKRFFNDDVHLIINKAVNDIALERNFEKNEDYVSFLTQYYTVAIAGLLENWLIGEIDKSPEELVQLLNTIIQDHINGAEMRFFHKNG